MSHRSWIAPLTVLLLAAAVRLAFLDQESFWGDECVTSYMARQPLVSIVTGEVREPNYPSGQLVLAHLWIAATGTSDFAMRLLPVVAGIVGVAVTYGCARRAFGARDALLAAALLAINPAHIYLSQEFRTYTLLFVFAACMLWAAIAYYDVGSTRSLLAWAAAAAVGMQIHHYAALAAVPLSLWMAVVQPSLGHRARWAAANAAVALAGLFSLWGSTVEPEATSAAEVVYAGVLHFAMTPASLLFGRTLAWQDDGVAAVAVVLAAATVVWACAFAYGWRTLPYRSGLVTAALAPAAIAILMMVLFRFGTWDDRKAFIILPPVVLMLAYGLGRAPRGLRATLLATIVAGSGLSWARYVVETYRDDWRSLAAALDERLMPGDVILVSPDEASCALRRYLQASDPQRMYGDAIVAYSVDDSAYVAYAKEGNEVTPAPPAGLDRSQRIWLVIDRRRLESDALLAQLAERELPLKPVERPVEFARRLSLVPCTVEEPVSGDDAGP